MQSLPVRECGLKRSKKSIWRISKVVTPRAGVWIETSSSVQVYLHRSVTPRAGVWIETLKEFFKTTEWEVTPRAGVWIETHSFMQRLTSCEVTPRAGVWIETQSEHSLGQFERSHSPCGSVD